MQEYRSVPVGSLVRESERLTAQGQGQPLSGSTFAELREAIKQVGNSMNRVRAMKQNKS